MIHDGMFVYVYGSLSVCHTNRQIVSAIMLENLCSQAFKTRMYCEGGGVWKDVVSGFYYIYVYEFCIFQKRSVDSIYHHFFISGSCVRKICKYVIHWGCFIL